MLSELTYDALASMIKVNPELEAIIQAIQSDNKKTTSMLVHELRNPLSLLKGTIQYIEMKHPDVKEYKYWDQIQDLINDMERIMQDASMLNNSTILKKEDTDLIDLLRGIVNNFMPQAITQNIDLALEVSPGCEELLSSYYCDGGKLKQVFTNMIKNAFEATKPGDFIHIAIGLDQSSIPAKLYITLSNNGQLIPEAALENIFKPFVSYKKGGTGVGLALAKKVVDLHYGSISVASTDSLTTFTILLPI